MRNQTRSFGRLLPRWLRLVLLVALLPFAGAPGSAPWSASPVAAQSPSCTDDFVRRDPATGSFTCGGKPFRFIGVNIRSLIYLKDWNDENLEAQKALYDQLSGAAQMRSKVIRVYLANANYNKHTFPGESNGVKNYYIQMGQRLKNLIAFAKTEPVNLGETYGEGYKKAPAPDIKFLVNLTDGLTDKAQANFVLDDDINTYDRTEPFSPSYYFLNHEWFYSKSDLNRNPNYNGINYEDNYLPFVRHIADQFKSEKQIFAWQLGNEFKFKNSSQLITFTKAVASEIKRYDPNHMVTPGFLSIFHAALEVGNEKPILDMLYNGDNLLDFGYFNGYNNDWSPVCASNLLQLGTNKSISGSDQAMNQMCEIEWYNDHKLNSPNKYPYILGEFGFSGAEATPESCIGYSFFPGGKWEELELPSTEKDRGPTIDPVLKKFFNEKRLDGLLQWGYAYGGWGESDDKCKGMDDAIALKKESESVPTRGHLDWYSLDPIYKCNSARLDNLILPECQYYVKYFDNADLSGHPAFLRYEGGNSDSNKISRTHKLEYDELNGIEDDGVFSEHITGNISIPFKSKYQFTAEVTGAIKVSVDGKLLIDTSSEMSAMLDLTKGEHTLTIEYFPVFDDADQTHFDVQWVEVTSSLDLSFVVDTTGSMDDDIAAVKAAAADIVSRLTERGVNYRIAIVTFNDPAALTHIVLPLSADQPTIISRINSLSAGGGGDEPETVYSGLMAAVGRLDWRSNVPRAIILMGDAPPKDPEPDTGYTLTQVTAAARAGRIGVGAAAHTASLAAATQLALTPDSIRIYPILIGADPAARQSFQALADQSGGSLFSASAASNVVAAILQAVDEITLAPVADAGGPYSGVAGQAITLDGSGSRDSDGAIVEYTWDVNGDGAPDVRSARPTAAYTYTQMYSGSVTLQVTDNDGRTGVAQASIAIAPPALRLPALSGTPGQIVRVPVYVDTPVNGLAAASLTVQFDSRVLRPRGALAYPGSLTTGWAVAANDRVAGRVRVALASSGAPASGAGTLAELEFEVLGSVGSSSPLQIVRAALNDGAIPASTQSGSFTVVPPRYQISVKAVHATSQSPLANTAARASGPSSATCLTNASGACALTNLLSGTYTVVLTKTDEVGGIGSLDASLILQHNSGSRVLTGAAFTAGDVSGDGQVTAQDANLVLQYVSGTASLPLPAGKIWAFTPLSYALLTQNQQPIVPGVLIGDVSGHLPPGTLGLRSAADRAGALQLVERGAPDMQGYRTLQLWFQPGQESLLSLVAALRFDPALVTDVQVQPDKPAGALAVAQVRPDGQVRLALAAAWPLGTGALLTLRYRSSAGGGWSLTNAEPNQDGAPAWQTPAGAGWRLFLPYLTR